MVRALVLSPLVVAVVLAAACSTGPDGVAIDVTAGQETSAWDGITKVTIEVTSLDGTVKVATSTTPDGGPLTPNGSAFDLGEISNGEQITVGVLGYAGDEQVMTGSSLSGLLLSSIEGGTLPVFVARENQWARPPGSLVASHVGGVAAVVSQRYVLLTGGARAAKDTTSSAGGVDSYDVFALSGDATTQAFDPVPETIISLDPTDDQPDPQLVLISSGGANQLDYATGLYTALDIPTGWAMTDAKDDLTYADLAGGRVIQACVPTSAGGCSGGIITYVVGATRRGSKSRAVLEVDSDGGIGGFALNTAREGAAAAWIQGVGLVVAGGSADGAGVEILPDGATTFTTSYLSDATQGAAAILSGDNGVVLVGGVLNGAPAATRLLDLVSCGTSSCAPMPIPAATLPVALQNTVGYRRSDETYLVIGDDLSGTGLTLSFLVDTTNTPSAKAVPFEEPRQGATAIDVPNGTVAVLGGAHADGTPALSVEMFYP